MQLKVEKESVEIIKRSETLKQENERINLDKISNLEKKLEQKEKQEDKLKQDLHDLKSQYEKKLENS